jgi:acetyl esterase/lipase
MKMPRKKIFLTLLTLLLTPLLSGCTRAAFVAVNIPAWFSPHRTVRDVAYGDKPNQKLDIYIPASVDPNSNAPPRDVIVFLYGGRWTYGEKENYSFIGKRFADQNFITVIPDYPKYPDVRFPTFVEESAVALAWVHSHIAEYNGNPARIHVIGHSAGAHIGALLTADAHYLNALGKTPAQVIHDFVGLAGPYAFTPDEPDLIAIFPEPYDAMRVPTFITGHEPPMLLLWGDADSDVGRFNLERLQTAIEAQHGKVRSIIYPAQDHIDLIKNLSWLGSDAQPVLPDILGFISNETKPTQ